MELFFLSSFLCVSQKFYYVKICEKAKQKLRNTHEKPKRATDCYAANNLWPLLRHWCSHHWLIFLSCHVQCQYRFDYIISEFILCHSQYFRHWYSYHWLVYTTWTSMSIHICWLWVYFALMTISYICSDGQTLMLHIVRMYTRGLLFKAHFIARMHNKLKIMKTRTKYLYWKSLSCSFLYLEEASLSFSLIWSYTLNT